jgi:thioredoxin 2
VSFSKPSQNGRLAQSVLAEPSPTLASTTPPELLLAPLDDELAPLELPPDDELEPPELLPEEEAGDPELLELDAWPSGLPAPASCPEPEPPLAQACARASGTRKRPARAPLVRSMVCKRGVRKVMTRGCRTIAHLGSEGQRLPPAARAALDELRRSRTLSHVEAHHPSPGEPPPGEVLMIVHCSSCSRSNRVPARRVGDKARCAACKAELLPLDHPIPIASSADFDELVREVPAPVLVDFWADWCGPCRMVAPELEKLAKARAGSVIVAKVDTEALPEVAARFGIRSIPTMIVFRGGQEADRLSGAMAWRDISARLGV